MAWAAARLDAAAAALPWALDACCPASIAWAVAMPA